MSVCLSHDAVLMCKQLCDVYTIFNSPKTLAVRGHVSVATRFEVDYQSSRGGGGPHGWIIFCKMRSAKFQAFPAFVCPSHQGRRVTYPDQLRPHLCQWLVLSQRDVCEERAVADEGGVGVALDIGPPLPARRVRMAGSDVLGLKPFEFLLVAKLVGLESRGDRV